LLPAPAASTLEDWIVDKDNIVDEDCVIDEAGIVDSARKTLIVKIDIKVVNIAVLISH
jgi:hypothetical protein